MKKNHLLTKALVVMFAALVIMSCGGGGSDNGPALSSAKAITTFSILSPAATGVIDETTKTIYVTVPGDTDVTALIATFTTTGRTVTVNTVLQVSGSNTNDFTNPVLYVVKAADGTTATYTVFLVHVGSSPTPTHDFLPKTGQTTCFDEFGTVIACTDTGQDGELQKGLEWPSPRFTTNSDKTITDNLTGLIWDAIGDPMLTIYTDFDTDGYNDGAVTWQHALDFIVQLNTDNYLGHNDWRLPNRNELISIANYGEEDGKAWLNTEGFSIADGGSYWTSTSSEYNHKMAYYVELLGSAGSIISDYKTTYSSGGFTFYPAHYVWAVRGGQGAVAWAKQPQTGQTLCYAENGTERACAGTGEDGELKVGVSWPNPRFTNADYTTPISGNVVVDRLTGLIWSKDGNTPGPAECIPGVTKNWQGALDYVACLNANNYLGYSDWRLPNANELGSLVNAGQSNTASWLNNQGFTNAQSFHYWSSTPSSHRSLWSSLEAFSLNMYTGAPLSGADIRDNVFDAWPVRAGQNTTTVTAVSAAHVPDTGQTDSYTATFGEDHDYTANAPSYTDNSNGTITDNITYLVWQKLDDNTLRQWDAANAYCAALSLAGTGWRLPTPYELITITDYGIFDPSIDTALFPATKGAFYWSTESPFSDAWIGEFYSGGMVAGSKAASGYTRCVRGGNRVFKFIDNADGTVTDENTNLTWQQEDDNAPKSWEDALSYCEGLELPSGVTDWRLPNVKELSSIVDFVSYPVSNSTFFPNTDENFYWTSTTVAEPPTQAWQISFLGGNVSDTAALKTNTNYVRCVRGQ